MSSSEGILNSIGGAAKASPNFTLQRTTASRRSPLAAERQREAHRAGETAVAWSTTTTAGVRLVQVS